MSDVVTDPLTVAALDTERHVARDGWDQPPRLFALVRTDLLLRREPTLVAQLDASAGIAGELTAVEQDGLPEGADIGAQLARLQWPPTVSGVALAIERIVVPREAESGLPEDPAQAAAHLAAHPQRQDVRLLVAVLRPDDAGEGGAVCLLRQRAHDRDDRVARGRDIAPGLIQALQDGLRD